MRLIDADAFKDYIRGACEEMKHLYKDNGAWAKEITEGFCKDIDKQPTIQPEPAQWVQMLINPRMYRCSNCNIAWNKRLVFDLDNGNEMVMKYCPCCGKKMLAEVDYE